MSLFINFLKRTFLYKKYHKKQLEKYNKSIELRKQYFKKEAEVVFNKFANTLNSENITFWLDFGTLLGYYRDNDFIKHDFDMDFGAFIEDAPIIRKMLESNGFKRIVKFVSSDGGLEECYKYLHITLDIFYFREEGARLYCNSFSSCPHKTILEKLSNKKLCYVKKIYTPNGGLTKVYYKGCNVYIPKMTIEHLEMHYGKSFMIPNPQFDYKKEATNIVYYDLSDVYGYAYKYGKK